MSSQRAALGTETGSRQTRRLRLPALARWRQLIGASASRAADSLAETLGKGATCTGCCAV